MKRAVIIMGWDSFRGKLNVYHFVRSFVIMKCCCDSCDDDMSLKADRFVVNEEDFVLVI